MGVPSYGREHGHGEGEIDFGTLISCDRSSNTNDRLIIRPCTCRLMKCVLLLLNIINTIRGIILWVIYRKNDITRSIFEHSGPDPERL